MAKEVYRKYNKDKEVWEYAQLIFCVFFLLVIIGQLCQYYGYVIYLDF